MKRKSIILSALIGLGGAYNFGNVNAVEMDNCLTSAGDSVTAKVALADKTPTFDATAYIAVAI